MPGLLDAAEVADAIRMMNATAISTRNGAQRAAQRDDGGPTRRHRYRHGQDVVGQQGDTATCAGCRPKLSFVTM